MTLSAYILRIFPASQVTRTTPKAIEEPSGDIVTYAYNGDGLRVWQDDGVDEVRYVHDGNNVLLETDGLGTVEAEFTYIPQAYTEKRVFGFQF